MDGILELTLLLLLALVLDAVFGDPRWLPHPVRGIGLCAAVLEKITRAAMRNETAAGVLSVLVNILIWCGLSGFSTFGAQKISPALGMVVAAVWIYFTVASQDLASHVRRVAVALQTEGLDGGRRAVGMIVGRDTDVLDESGIVRAGLESAGENLVDAVTSALFWAAVGWWIGGVSGSAVMAVMLRVVNTLDATYGYQNERYQRFGWFAAKLDDCAHFLPARLTMLAMLLAALWMRTDAARVWRVTLRDHGHHASPNSGWGEAALAGLLDVTLGGRTCYGGEWIEHEPIGDGQRLLETPRLFEAASAVRIASVMFMLMLVVFSAILVVLKTEGRG